MSISSSGRHDGRIIGFFDLGKIKPYDIPADIDDLREGRLRYVKSI
jgi:hypothetical protein